VHKVRLRLKNPPFSVAEYLATLKQVGLVALTGELGAFSELI
jgi:hypothetical protein